MENLPLVSFFYKLWIGLYWYAGSGTEGVVKRMKGHYEASIECPNRRVYKYIAENGGWPAVRMEILYTSSAYRTQKEVWAAEQTLIDKSDPYCLNTNNALITDNNRKHHSEYPSHKDRKSKYQSLKKDPVAWAADQKRRQEIYDEKKKDPLWIKAENTRKAEAKRKNREQKAAKRIAEALAAGLPPPKIRRWKKTAVAAAAASAPPDENIISIEK